MAKKEREAAKEKEADGRLAAKQQAKQRREAEVRSQSCTRSRTHQRPVSQCRNGVLPIVRLTLRADCPLPQCLFGYAVARQKKERRNSTTGWLEDTLFVAPALNQDGTVVTITHTLR